MKRIITILLALVMAVLLCGCGNTGYPIKKHHDKRFLFVERYRDCLIYVDTETGVKYANYDGCMTVLLDGYGNPLVWEGYDAREDGVTTP